ncbi:MAG TPA: transcription-repair coupling factor [Chlamydiales bacterium]|nr:transcription-repair coupling factor [Chlamydiales bacterium]
MIERLTASSSIKALQETLKQGNSVLVEELWDTTKALLTILAVETTKKSILLLTGGVREDSLFDNISQMAPELAIEFPAWETLPGEEIPPSPDIIGKRMEALHLLLHRKGPSIVLCPIASFLQKIPRKEHLKELFSSWKKGSQVPFDQIPQRLTDLGYRRVAVVSDKGEFAIRGGIVDLFPVAAEGPYRVDFFGDEIEEIRIFDPIGQKSIQKVDSFFLSPARELDLLQKATRLSSISDYLGEEPLYFWDDLLAIEDTIVALKNMPGAKSTFFFSFDEALKQIKNGQNIFCAPQNIEQLSEVMTKERTKSMQQVFFEAFSHRFEASRFFHPFRTVADYFEISDGSLLDFLNPAKNLRLFFINANQTEEEEVQQKLSSISLPQGTVFERGYLTSGFVVADIPLAVIPNSEITKRTRIRRQKWRNAYHTPAAEFHALSPNDLVVHFHSGIGRYLGLEKHTNHLGVEVEFLAIEYADKSKLFVPLSQAYLVSRYIGSKEEPPNLSQLGGKRWIQARAQAQTQIVGYANDLLQMYASRAAHGGFACRPDSEMMKQFEADFPYEETADQLLAIAAIKQDMMSEKAMDRIICGDVGYGKTEVAMRAAFKAVVDGGKQVALLVPTTVLAMQHYETFSTRMRGFPIHVDLVSRFRTPKQTKETLKKLEEGKVDILIGTHRLLSEDIRFKNLGLIIIDEEQRFGVRAKEHLKKLKVGVDCLTLSATPIPRTLYMSLVNARDMSVIATPPQDRLPVKTIIAETEDELIANALLREFSRGGQAFFIHNRVETIFGKATAIGKLVPSARIGVIHGQMDSEDIDATLHRYKQAEIDLLFATTIIENGIDIPNANTILIDRADTYGLADLYQLRGRVGRWNRAAYAYFLIPKNARLPELTRKRLNALVEAGGYGGGMKIAMRDLEIRGAGDILGVQQSGQVSAIGFHLYCKLLKRAIDALKKKKDLSFEETKMEFSYDARLPESYINEVSLRMELYYRIGEASSYPELDDLLQEMEDRFGQPPEEVLWLYHLARVRVFASANHFSLLKFGNLSLLAERQKGKELEKKNLLLPKKMQSPKELEAHVIFQLKKSFVCDREPT